MRLPSGASLGVLMQWRSSGEEDAELLEIFKILY